METPTGITAGVVLVLFGGALLFWCAAETLLRRRVRRSGVPVTARVVADGDAFGGLDSAPLLAFSTLPSVGGSAGCGEALLVRPRGHTPLRRPASLGPGAEVPVVYDPQRPGRVVLAADAAVPTLADDVFWVILGAGGLAGGLVLLALVPTG